MKNKDKLILKEIDSTRVVLQKGIDRVMNNLENLEELQEKSLRLQRSAALFKRYAHKSKMDTIPWYKTRRFKGFVLAASLTTLAVTSFIILGATCEIPASIAVAASIALVALFVAACAAVLMIRHHHVKVEPLT